MRLTYYDLQVTDAIEQLDMLVKTRRIQTNQSRDIKSHVGQPHARRLGEPREKPLPYPGKGDAIHLDLIDPTWLAEHPESASCRMILHWTKLEAEEEGELADVEDDDEGEGAQGADDDDIDPQLRADPDNGGLGEFDTDSEGLYAD